jgi:hypothetical protein
MELQGRKHNNNNISYSITRVYIQYIMLLYDNVTSYSMMSIIKLFNVLVPSLIQKSKPMTHANKSKKGWIYFFSRNEVHGLGMLFSPNDSVEA